MGARLALALAVALVACKHDLEPLQSGLVGGKVPAPLRDSGPPQPMNAGRDADGGVAGASGRVSTAGAGGTGSPAADSCEPCDRLSAAATQVGLRSCCRGTTNEECGLTFGEGAVCLNRMVPGKSDPDCSAMMVGGMQLAGCCRPDGRCGVVAAPLGLGCLARDELPRAIGGSAEPVFCNAECATDGDCEGTPTTNRCSENDDRSARYCAVECARDRDCPRGLICALTNDVEMDRVLAVCRPPVGDQVFGEFCSAATDCVSGVCLMIEQQEPYCSRLCRNPTDCPEVCFESTIPSPRTGQLQSFSICEK